MNLFFSAGEPSGDLHGANLIRSLRDRDPNTHVTGFGGPKMSAAGAELLFPLTELAVMGFRRVLNHLPTFFRLAALAEHSLRRHRPDAVVLIDYPGFNFALARRAHALGIPVYYFVPPQLWAWRRGRVREVRKWCSGVLSALPFEDDWYRARGVRTYYTGHPYFDELARQQLDPEFMTEQRDGGLNAQATKTPSPASDASHQRRPLPPHGGGEVGLCGLDFVPSEQANPTHLSPAVRGERSEHIAPRDAPGEGVFLGSSPYASGEHGRAGRPIVGLLPGSRNQEVAGNFAMMLAAGRKIHAARPGTRFLVAAFNDRHAAAIREQVTQSGLPVGVHVGRTPEIIELADACVAVSGSVSLELMYRAKPTVIVYRMSPLSLWLARRLVKLPYFTLVNLLAGEELFPEIATSRDESDRIAGHVLGWLGNDAERQRMASRVAALRDRVAVPGACDRAADFLLNELAARRAA